MGIGRGGFVFQKQRRKGGAKAKRNLDRVNDTAVLAERKAVMSEHENEGNVEQNACCNVCSDGGCSIGRSGWKWSLFTLAALIIAGVATATVLAGEKTEDPKPARSCGWSKSGSCDAKPQGASGEAEAAEKSCEAGAKAACSEAKAQGVSGEKEAQEGKSCPVTGAKESGCCPSKAKAACSEAAQQGAAGEKEAPEGKTCCSEKKDCGSKNKV